MEDHIIFFSSADLGNKWDWKKVEYLLNIPEKKLSLENILELYEAEKFMVHFKDEIKVTDKYKVTLRKIKQLEYKCFPKINDENILTYFDKIEIRNYRKNFFKLIEKKKDFKELTGEGFIHLIKSRRFSIIYILSCENLINIWGRELFKYALENTNIIPIMMVKYIDPEHFSKDWTLPREVDNPNSWKKLVSAYISSADPNINYLEDIVRTPNFGNFKISTETKYLAKKQLNKITKGIFSTHKKDFEKNKFNYRVWFSEKEDWKTLKIEDRNISIRLSKNWVVENLDYPTLLNNFIYLFGLADFYSRSSLISLKAQRSELEEIFRNWTEHSFKNSIGLESIFIVQRMQMQSYYQLLKENGIRIEEVIGWFFNIYIPDEFNIKGFKYNVPSSTTSFLEKCKLLFSELDSIIGQFDLYSSKKKLDWQFLEFESTPVDLQNVKSLIPHKYIYLTKKGSVVSNLLFSDQCFVSVQVKFNVKSFYEGISKNKIFYNDLEMYDKPSLDSLIKNKIVIKKDNGILSFNKNLVNIIKNIYEHGEFEPYYFKTAIIKKHLDILYDKDIIRNGNTLVSEPEYNFYSYICNNKKYTNGLALRNKYLHGRTNYSEKENEENFYIVLLLTVQIIIRINEELCWQDGHKLLRIEERISSK